MSCLSCTLTDGESREPTSKGVKVVKQRKQRGFQQGTICNMEFYKCFEEGCSGVEKQTNKQMFAACFLRSTSICIAKGAG